MKPIKTEYLVVGGIGIAAIAYVVMKKKTPETVSFIPDAPAALPAATSAAASATPVVVTLNKALVLKKGSTGNEVKELQKLLGVTADGIFGAQTEAALVAKKAVKEISLAAYTTAATVNQNALPTGTRVMANKKPQVTIFRATPLANNSYNLDSSAVSNIDYGKEVGTIKMLSIYKTRYLIALPGQSVIYGWVNADDVSKI